MATRSTIAMEYDDGMVRSIFCLCDGYPSNNGIILMDYYNDREKLRALLCRGDIESLEKNVEAQKVRYKAFFNAQDETTRFYDHPFSSSIYSDVAEYRNKCDFQGHDYFMDSNGTWWYKCMDNENPDEWLKLEEVLAGITEENSQYPHYISCQESRIRYLEQKLLEKKQELATLRANEKARREKYGKASA